MALTALSGWNLFHHDSRQAPPISFSNAIQNVFTLHREVGDVWPEQLAQLKKCQEEWNRVQATLQNTLPLKEEEKKHLTGWLTQQITIYLNFKKTEENAIKLCSLYDHTIVFCHDRQVDDETLRKLETYGYDPQSIRKITRLIQDQIIPLLSALHRWTSEQLAEYNRNKDLATNDLKLAATKIRAFCDQASMRERLLNVFGAQTSLDEAIEDYIQNQVSPSPTEDSSDAMIEVNKETDAATPEEEYDQLLIWIPLLSALKKNPTAKIQFPEQKPLASEQKPPMPEQQPPASEQKSSEEDFPLLQAPTSPRQTQSRKQRKGNSSAPLATQKN